MKVIIILKTILVFGVGILSAVTDIKHGKIFNKYIIVFMSAAMILDCVEWFTFDKSYLFHQLANILICILISLVLYFFHIWAGGDAKLMIAVSLLIPYDLYINTKLLQFNLIYIFVFSFIFSYIYLIADTISGFIKGKVHADNIKKTALKSVIDYLSCVLYIIFFDQIFQKLLPQFFEDYAWILLIINICIVFIISGLKIMKNRFVLLILIVTTVVLKIVFNQPILSKQMIINYVVALFFIILRVFIDEYNYETINVSKLRPGMILSAATTITFMNSKVKGLPEQSTEDLRSRLTEDEINSILRWSKSKYGLDTVQIVRKIPFAIFITLGTVLFVITGALIK